ncbi:MAG: O-antigen polymerase, partial [Ramlibacter sp.]|nr:O-antigen polymerase [Ramlibacter sp.]
WISQTQQAGEAFANLRQRNQFATLTSIGLLALIGWLALRAKASHVQGWRVPGWAYPLVLLLALGNAASSSRTGLLQWLLIGVLSAWWALPGRWRLLVFVLQALLAYGIAVVTLPGLLEWATGQQSGGLFGRLVDSTGCSSRMILWSNVLTLIAQKPWLGWGWGELDYAHFVTLYPGPRFCEILDNAHNLPLHLAVELGLPAALLACGAALVWAWRRQPWREADARRQLAWAWIAVMLLHGMLEYPLWYGPFQVLFGISVGWLAASQGAARQAEVRRGPALAAIGVLLLATCYAAWDYARVSQIYIAPEERRAAWREDTLSHVRASWLFSGQARFAETTLSGLNRDNAEWMHGRAEQMLHYSPEPRIVERLIESATMTGREDEAVLHLARFRAAFPQEYAKWREEQRMPPQAPTPP